MPVFHDDYQLEALEEVAEVSSGNAAPQEKRFFENGKIPFVRVQDLGRYGRTANLLLTKDYVNDTAIKEKHLRIFPKGSILFPKSGVSTLLNHRAILGVDACVVSHLAVIRPREDMLLTKWLYYYLCTVDFSIMVSTTTLPSLQLSRIRQLKVPVPPIGLQRKIVSILERADSTKQKREEANRLTGKIAESTFMRMFGDPIRNPRNWPIARLEEILAEPLRNGLFKMNQFYGKGVPIVWVESLFDRYVLEPDAFRLIDVSEKEIKKYQLREGDILVCRSSLPVEGVGKMVVVENVGGPLLFESHVIRLRIDSTKALPQFVVGFYNSEPGRKLVLEKARIATMTTINQPDVKSFTIFLPPLELQRKFVEVLHKTRSLNQRQKYSTMEINELFNALMYKAFKGELALRDSVTAKN